MKYPSKVVRFDESVICNFSIVLKKLKKKDMSPQELYKKIKNINIKEFADILECLYATNKIELIGEKLHYVNKTSM